MSRENNDQKVHQYMTNNPGVEVSNLTVRISNIALFKNISFKVNPGKSVAVTGDSGKGKTTLLNTILGFHKPDEGSVKVFGKDVLQKPDETRPNFAYVPQALSFDFNLVSALFYFPFSFGRNKINKPDKASVDEILKKFRLDGSILNKGLSKISGGEKQRVILASISLLNKKIILLDEPASALDSDSKEMVMDHFFSLNNKIIITATHDKKWIDHSDVIINLHQASEQK